MSGQTHQRVRRNGSPSTTKQGPIKAVQAFSLKQAASNTPRNGSSPSPRDSHKLWTRKSPDHRHSPDSQSHSPNHCHKEKGKGLRHSPGKWRASSVDTVVPSYLTGQWPKDINSYHHYQSDGVFMCDKSTQTVDLETKSERKKKGHKRSASFGQGDQLKLQFIKHHLQKSKEGSKHTDSKQRSSPVPGNHSALSLTAPPALCAQQTKAILISSRHVPRHNMNRYQRNSVEGLNTEIEKLVSCVGRISVSPDGDDTDVFKQEIPDGHRAPVPDLSRLSGTRSVDTQTPSGHLDGFTTSSLVTVSRPASISPATPPRPGSADIHNATRSRSESTDSKSSKGDAETSPEPSAYLEKSCPFVREPPDGCEKVTVVEESRRPQIKEPMLFAPVKPNQFVFKPSQGSAFCPLIKSYISEFPITYNGSASPVLSAGIDG